MKICSTLKQQVNSLLKLIFATLLVVGCTQKNIDQNIEYDTKTGIHIYDKNPMYWQYDGEPVFLFGGSSNDNLHQNDGLIAELNLLDSLGGNFVRGNMSWRDEGDVKPYNDVNGIFDLDDFNTDYWNRFESLVTETKKRGIVIQLEIWPTVDFHKFNDRGWNENPFNPLFNSNYTTETSGLPEEHHVYHWEKLNPFFETVPGLSNSNESVLEYQRKYVDKILSYTLESDNILYCINNENYSQMKWREYWISYIKEAAKRKSKKVYCTDMFDNWDNTGKRVVPQNNVTLYDHPNHDKAGSVQTMIDHPEIYDFIDVSNNGAQFNEIHYSTLYTVYRDVHESGHPRPINVDKIYGGPINDIWTGDAEQGAERFWRNLFAGLASARFHRPIYGIGLNEYAQRHVKSMSMLLNQINLFEMEPDPWFVAYKGKHEVYTLANSQEGKYAILYLDGGEHAVNFLGKVQIEWLNILENKWLKTEEVDLKKGTRLKAPDSEFWIAYITKIK
ncbi:MAG: hypothetical protein J7K34_07270 [Flavobacteriaceae bacterium]|nr:hypothetical protein [Flavobacteriaceae bacterium]